jgi:hypothetical protein
MYKLEYLTNKERVEHKQTWHIFIQFLNSRLKYDNKYNKCQNKLQAVIGAMYVV